MLLATRASARGLATLNVVTFVVNAVVTGVSQTGLFGKDMSDVSDAYPTMVTPKSWAFNIWILIFLFEALFTLALFRERGRNSIYVRRITGWWTMAQVMQIAWVFAFAQEQIVMSSVMLFVLWLCLGVVVVWNAALPDFEATSTATVGAEEQKFNLRRRLLVGVPDAVYKELENAKATAPDFEDAVTDRSVGGTGTEWARLGWWFVFRFGFVLHFAWVTVAACINLTMAVVGEHATHESFEDQLAMAIIVTAFASHVALYYGLSRGLVPLPAVTAWGLFGIADYVTESGRFDFSDTRHVTLSGFRMALHTLAAAHALVTLACLYRVVCQSYYRKKQQARGNQLPAPGTSASGRRRTARRK